MFGVSTLVPRFQGNRFEKASLHILRQRVVEKTPLISPYSLRKGEKELRSHLLGLLFLRSLSVPACLDLGWYQT